MLILRAIAHEKEQATNGQALDQAIEHRLRPSIDPVQVFDEHQERLHLTPLQQQVLDAFDDTPAALRRIEGLPLWGVDGHVQQRQHHWPGLLEGFIPREALVNLLLYLALLVLVINLEIRPQEVTDGEVRSGLPV